MNTIKNTPIIGCMRWGSWGAAFKTIQYEQMIQSCLESGLDTFDHADIYGHYTTEADFGLAIKGNTSLRNNMKIITKCGIQLVSPNRPMHLIKSYNTSASHIEQSVEQSLKNFHTDYIDTLLIHRPDILLNPEAVAATITKLIKQGKIKTFGVSNFSTTQLDLLSKYIPIEHHQMEISVSKLNPFMDGLLDQCQSKRVEAQAWSPMGNNLLVEKNVKNERIIACINDLAKLYHASANQIMLAFLYAHPANITPVIGTTQSKRILEAKNAMTIDFKNEDFYKIWSASTGKEVA